MQLTVARWTIEHDPDATRACYAQISEALPCAPCPECENYQALCDGDLPQAFWKLLDALGIAFRKPAEITLPQPGAGTAVQYHLWYHFVGRIVSGADGWRPIDENGHMYDGEEITPGVSLGFSSQLSLVNDAFDGKPTVQLDFQLEAPWVSDIFSHPFYDAFDPAFAALDPES
jgi:hypothetical protein